MNNKVKNKVKDFDCLKMKNEIQSKLYEKMKDLTFVEQREFIAQILNSKIVVN